MPKVRLEHAWAWTCPNCTHRNTSRNDVASITEDDLREGMGLDPWESVPAEMAAVGEWYYAPGEVMCAACAKVYEAVDPQEEA